MSSELLEEIVLLPENSILFKFFNQGDLDKHLDEMWFWLWNYWNNLELDIKGVAHRCKIVGATPKARNKGDVVNYAIRLHQPNETEKNFGFIDVNQQRNKPNKYYVRFSFRDRTDFGLKFMKNYKESAFWAEAFVAYVKEYAQSPTPT